MAGPKKRPRPRPLTPRVRAWIVKLRREVPQLGLRKIAAALGLSLHSVRQALLEPPPKRRRVYHCCPIHGRVRYWPCPACQASRPKRRPL